MASKYYDINDDRARNLDIQEMLRYIGKILDDPSVSAYPSGVYDNATESAVREFQKKYSIPVTGIVDYLTFEAIRREYDRLLREYSSPVSLDAFEGYTLMPAEKSDLVYILQVMLNSLREKYDFIPPLPISGVYTGETANAVIGFKKAHKMSDTPQIDKKTWDALAREYNLTRRQ